MPTKNSTLITENAITVVLDFTPYTVRKDHPRYSTVEDVVKRALAAEANGEDTNELWQEFVDVLAGKFDVVNSDMKRAETVMDGLEYKDGEVYYNGTAIHNAVIPIIRLHINEGIDTKPLMNFLSKLLKNPSFRSVEQLWSFVEKNGLSLDDDGNILFYKVVRENYYDKHSGKYLNTVGAEISCSRNMVNDDPDVACAEGFHVGGWKYSGPNGEFYSPGDRIVICRVDPADVVSVPKDSNAGKCRCCRYVVIGEYKEKLPQGVATVDGDAELANKQKRYDALGEDGAKDSVDDDFFDDDIEDEDDEDFDEDFDDDDDDDFDDDDDGDEQFDDDYENPADLENGDIAFFSYKGEYRRCEVTDIGSALLVGRLLKGDVSYAAGEARYRNFTVSLMENVERY